MDALFVIQTQGGDAVINGLGQVKVFATRELATEHLEGLIDPYGRKAEVREVHLVT